MAESNGTSAASSPVRDHREPPRGVLPRQLQMWLMAGLAVVIVLIILVAGHSQPPAPPSSAIRPATTTLPDGDRIRAYQQQLAADETRLRQVQKEAMTTPRPSGGSRSPRVEQSDPVDDEARRRDYQSLFADNVVLKPSSDRTAAGRRERPGVRLCQPDVVGPA